MEAAPRSSRAKPRAARVQPGHVGAGRADPERERLPPLVEAGEAAPDGQHGRLDLAHSGGGEELRQVPLPGTRESRLVVRLRVEFERRPPEQRERTATAGVVPHAGPDHSPATGDPGHLRSPPPGRS